MVGADIACFCSAVRASEMFVLTDISHVRLETARRHADQRQRVTAIVASKMFVLTVISHVHLLLAEDEIVPIK